MLRLRRSGCSALGVFPDDVKRIVRELQDSGFEVRRNVIRFQQAADIGALGLDGWNVGMKVSGPDKYCAARLPGHRSRKVDSSLDKANHDAVALKNQVFDGHGVRSQREVPKLCIGSRCFSPGSRPALPGKCDGIAKAS
jgi:hypothetical protein